MIYRFRRISGGNVMPEDQETKDAVGKMAVGDMLQGKFTKMRNPQFHRKFFALLNHAFQHWEPRAYREDVAVGGDVTAPLKEFEQFREDITIMAGYYTSSFRVDGTAKLRAKSISFGKMDEAEFEKLYSSVINVILEHVLTNYDKDDIDRVVEHTMRFA